MENIKPKENRAYQEMLQVAVKRLKGRPVEIMAAKSGATFHCQKRSMEVQSFHEKIEIQLPDFTVCPVMEEWHHLLLLHYLDLADGAEETGHLITFGNLKDGLIRGTKFDHTAEQELEKILKNKTPEKVEEACKKLGAEFIATNADLCASFRIFPKYPIILKVWFADDEFPVSGKLFLQDNADHYLSVEDAVTAGEVLLKKLDKILI